MNYNPDYTNTHTVQITLNDNGYLGHIRIKIGGNTKGADILSTAIDWFDDCGIDEVDAVDNDCNLELDYDEDEDVANWSGTLTNANNDKLIFDATDDEIKDMVVSVEIIDYIPED